MGGGRSELRGKRDEEAKEDCVLRLQWIESRMTQIGKMDADLIAVLRLQWLNHNGRKTGRCTKMDCGTSLAMDRVTNDADWKGGR